LPLVAVLADHRRDQGRSQLDVASEIGIAQSHVCRWETGQSNPTIGHLIAYADALGCVITVIPKEDQA
jgi:transcriptional regulator with XRE-family HTH domain